MENCDELLIVFAIVIKHQSIHFLPVQSTARLSWFSRNPKEFAQEIRRRAESTVSPAPSEAPSLPGLWQLPSPTGNPDGRTKECEINLSYKRFSEHILLI